MTDITAQPQTVSRRTLLGGVAAMTATAAVGGSVLQAPTASAASYNTAPKGQCTWGAKDRFNARYGFYPDVYGNAKDWHDSAIAGGYTVDMNAVPHSIVVFQPGVHGANPRYGHVGWVASVDIAADGSRSLLIKEMNWDGDGAWHWRRVDDVVGMSYIRP
ncbi:CHAP domain-containing protein [Kytococcus sedentarius]|uniref:CHAP domain-containing protein n=1 Tax=Kytococcus sedentarius TaxID=1276 RepID=UPI0035BBD52A